MGMDLGGAVWGRQWGDFLRSEFVVACSDQDMEKLPFPTRELGGFIY